MESRFYIDSCVVMSSKATLATLWDEPILGRSTSDYFSGFRDIEASQVVLRINGS